MNRHLLILGGVGAALLLMSNRQHPTVKAVLGDGRPNTPQNGGALNPPQTAVDTCVTQPVGMPCVDANGRGGHCTATHDCLPTGDKFTDQDSMI